MKKSVVEFLLGIVDTLKTELQILGIIGILFAFPYIVLISQPNGSRAYFTFWLPLVGCVLTLTLLEMMYPNMKTIFYGIFGLFFAIYLGFLDFSFGGGWRSLLLFFFVGFIPSIWLIGGLLELNLLKLRKK